MTTVFRARKFTDDQLWTLHDAISQGISGLTLERIYAIEDELENRGLIKKEESA